MDNITITRPGYIFYLRSIEEANRELNGKDKRPGKWRTGFPSMEAAEHMCRKAIDTGVVTEAKHSDGSDGSSNYPAFFYVDAGNIEGHKKVINFFLENDLIRKTKAGKLYNISFKLDEQTAIGQYGKDFKAEIKLSDFIDLYTGEWIYREENNK